TSGSGHGKILGGKMHLSFDWTGPYSSLVTQSSAIAVSSAAGDDTNNPNLSNVTTDQGANSSSGSTTLWGYRFKAPADTFTRTLTIYGAVFSAAATITVRS